METYDDYFAVIQNLKAHGGRTHDRKNHRLPMACYAESDCEFFFTICARHLGEPFLEADLARSVVEALLWRKQRHQWTLYCYCLMPDHLHFVVRLPDRERRTFNAGARGVVPDGILDQIGNFKKFTTTQIWWKLGGTGPLWQRSSYDSILRYNNSVEPVIYYVLSNPVRKGLVTDWRDYPYAGVVDPW